MPPPLPVFARRSPDRIVFGETPTPLPIVLLGLRSADGHAVTAYARAAVRGVDRPADARLFAEQLLAGRDAVSAEDVARHFAAALTPAAGDLIAARPAADALTRRAETEHALQDRFDAVAFGCGLERTSPLSLTLDCPTLRDEQNRQAARQRQAADAEHAAALARSLDGAAGRADDASLSVRLAAMPATCVAVSAGPNVVLLYADGGVRVVGVPVGVGAVRSVRAAGDGRLAVGGVAGVALLRPDGTPLRVLTGGGRTGRGFNAVAWTTMSTDDGPADRVAATHGEIGLTCWDGDAPPRVVATPGPARHLVAGDGTFVLAAGRGVFGVDGDALRPIDDGPAAVVGVVISGGRVVVVREDGGVRQFDPRTLSVVGEARVDSPVVAAAAIDTPGRPTLIVADDRGDVDAVTPDGRPLGRLASRLGGVRMLAAAGGRVFVVTADRTSVVCIDPAGIDRPRTTNVVARTGHHVTDLVAV